MQDEILIEKIEWQSKEYEIKERNIDWFWAVGIIGLVIIGIAFWMHNYLFAIFIVIAVISLFYLSTKEPEEIKYIISNEGFKIGPELFIWKNVKGFNMHKHKDQTKLFIEVSKKFIPIYTINIPTNLEEIIKENLQKVTKQKELKESNSVLFMEKIGF